MNEDRMITMLSNLDDDLAEQVTDHLMQGVEYDMESIKRKSRQRLEKHNRKMKLRQRLPYAAAVLACFIFINTAYADEISQAVKNFFNKTPVYSTMVDGKAYYLKERLVANKDLTVDSIIVAEGRIEMNLTSNLDEADLGDIKILPKNAPGTEYTPSGYGKDGDHKYFLFFMNAKENNYNIRPFQAFDLLMGGKTYSITLDEAKSLDSTQKLTASEATANNIDLVTVGANSIEKNGQQAIQLIAAFKNDDMKLTAFGQPVTTTVKTTFEDLGKDGVTSSGTGSRTEDIYATDQSGAKHKLTVPADAKARPITTFETDAPKDSKLTVKLPALLAAYEKSVDSFTVNIPKDGENSLNNEVDLVAQKAVAKSIKRLSPTSAELTFQLNTGADKNISINSFSMNSKDVKKYSAIFNGDTAVVTLEFAKEVDDFNLEISWPRFVMNGDWTINLN